MNQLAQVRQSHPTMICGKEMGDELVLANPGSCNRAWFILEYVGEVVHHVKPHGLLVVTTTIRARGIECPLRDMKLSEPSCETYLHIGGTAIWEAMSWTLCMGTPICNQA